MGGKTERAQRNIRYISKDSSFPVTIKAIIERLEPSSRQARYRAELHAFFVNRDWQFLWQKKAERNIPIISNDLWREVSQIRQLGCAREQLVLKVYITNYSILKSCSALTVNLEDGCSFSFFPFTNKESWSFIELGAYMYDHHSQ